ncbi:unnamed protein product [Phytophthora fragariaefolia]|uniref:Unnamed protein product n=1 Tax=Phytophthora fragariaefolia TaxID=1490495 RepID=A0A9W6XPJ3_9STRA|nr:unnamed protein product [Phytophthora fragariaefolia]
MTPRLLLKPGRPCGDATPLLELAVQPPAVARHSSTHQQPVEGQSLVDDLVDATAVKTALWSEMRTALAVNNASIGLEYRDELAESLIDGDRHAKLKGLAVLLSAPNDQETSTGPTSHSTFQAGVSSAKPSATSKLRRPTNTRATASSKVATRSTKRSKTAAASSNSSPGRLSVVLSGTHQLARQRLSVY